MDKRRIGTKYEEVAAEYLVAQGYEVLERNHRNPFGEIDIIAQKDGVLVYAEIKFRSSGQYGSPLEAVDARKRKKISQAAGWHYAGCGFSDGRPCRFDVIGIGKDGSICHVEDAFEFQGQEMDF